MLRARVIGPKNPLLDGDDSSVGNGWVSLWPQGLALRVFGLKMIETSARGADLKGSYMNKTIARVGALVGAALLVTACQPAATETNNPAQGNAKDGGDIVIRGCTPQNKLMPANTGEVCGGNVMDAITSRLVRYNPDTAKPENEVAEKIDTTDSKKFTIKIKKGLKFHDGTDVKAKSFVDAWNFAAYAPNGQAGAYFFSPIKGYQDLQCPDAKCNAKPTKTEMEGLKVVDDYTFTIETYEPTSNLPVRLGYTAFAPAPESMIKDPEGYAKKPIGNGPFKFVSQDEKAIVVERSKDYQGPRKAHVDKVTFRIYNDPAAAYADVVANNLDVTDSIPADQLVGDNWKNDLKDRWAQKESGTIQVLTFSPVDEQLAGDKGKQLRKAISMAFDRQSITKQIFNGSRVPATGWVSPIVDGAKPDQCGEACKFEPAKAKEIYTKAGGYQGIFTITVNGDGGHKQWADAMCNQLKTNLGMDCQVVLTPDFKTLLNKLKNKEIKGAFRNGWQMDYPSIENFLAPIYGKGADSNYSGYDNPKFDAKLKEAAAAKDVASANKLYQEAEAMLAVDLPSVPKWYSTAQFGWSTKVTNVKITPFGTLDLSSISVK